MRVQVKFNIDFNTKNIVKNTNKSIEELNEYIDKELYEEMEELLTYELEDEGFVSISGVTIIK